VPLPRLQLFELNDHPAVPRALRETIVDALTLTLKWGHILDGLVDPLLAFARASRVSSLLDLASGAGGPADVIASALERRGERLDLLLTDLFPRVDPWRALTRRHPGVIDYVAAPVDATRIPEALTRGRARVIINAFHHLPPSLARGVVADAIRARSPLFISEGFERNPLRFLPFSAAGIAALLASPVLAERDRLARAWLVWGTPIALAASAWDGIVSTMRVYTEAELREMTAGSDTHTWTYGTYDFAPFGRGTYFYGVPR